MSLIRHRNPSGASLVKILVQPAKREATLVFDKETWEKINRFVALCPIECMWYHLISRLATTDATQVAFHITDLFIPEQIAADKEVEATPEGLNQLWPSVRAERSLDAKATSDMMKAATVWCHSHVEMPVAPSTQDDQQWQTLITQANARANSIPIAMVIINKKGEYFTRVYDPVDKYEYTNADIVVKDPTDYTYVEDAIATKVKKAPAKTELVKSSPTYTTPPVSSHVNQTPSPWPHNNSPSPGSAAKAGEKAGDTDTQYTFRSGESTFVVNWPELTESKKKPDGEGDGLVGGDDGSGGDVWDIARLAHLLAPDQQPLKRNLLYIYGIFTKLFQNNPDKLYTDICTVIAKLNGLARTASQARRYTIETLISLPKTSTGEPKTKWIRLVSLACMILETTASDDRKTPLPSFGETTEAILYKLKDFKGSQESIIKYFEGYWVENEALFPLALGIAFLLDCYSRDTPKNLEIGTKSLTNLLIIRNHIVNSKNPGLISS